MSGVFPIDPHKPAPEAGPAQIGRMPAIVRDAPPGFKATPGMMLEARVLGRDADGHLLLRTTAGVLSISAKLQPPSGSTVVLQFRTVGASVQAYIVGVRHGTTDRGPADMAARAPSVATGHGSPPDVQGAMTEGTGALTRAWPALEEALQALHGRSDAAPGALNALFARLPQPGANLASALLFLLSAMRGGDVRTWTGERPLTALSRLGHDDLIARLRQDFSQMARFIGDDGEPWHLYAIPVLFGDWVRTLRFFVHTPDPEETRDGAHRVVVEAELPELGEIQLDTLLRRHRMDMILRTRTALADALRERIEAIVRTAKAWGRLDGGLEFAPGPNWQFLKAPAADEPAHGIVV